MADRPRGKGRMAEQGARGNELRRKRRIVIAMLLGTVGFVSVGAASCGTNNFRDVKGAGSRDPDKIEIYNNADQNPNVTMLCIHGVAFATTTRQYNAILRVPEWDRQCPGYQAK